MSKEASLTGSSTLRPRPVLEKRAGHKFLSKNIRIFSYLQKASSVKAPTRQLTTTTILIRPAQTRKWMTLKRILLEVMAIKVKTCSVYSRPSSEQEGLEQEVYS